MTQVIKACFIAIVRFYQIAISPFKLGCSCRFYPSCSQYALGCLRKDGLAKAVVKIFVRLLKCQPFHPGGIDLP